MHRCNMRRVPYKVDLGMTFSLNFKDLVAGFGETIADLMRKALH
jgi:hypothetical protein